MTVRLLFLLQISLLFSSLSAAEIPVPPLLINTYEQAAVALDIPFMNLPKLKISAIKTRGASFNKNDNVIDFDQVLFNECLKLDCNPEAALLFILGHELGHFIEDQTHPYGFIDHIQNDENLKKELKADYFGIVACVSNGYATTEMINELFSKLTIIYQPENEEKYMAIPARIEKVNILKSQIKNFSYVFEIGKYLLQVGAIDQAMVCYSYLKQFLQIPEILNDWSTCKLIWSLEAYRVLATREVPGYNLKEINYAFPFEMDPEARLFQKATKGIAIAEETNKEITTTLKKVYREVQRGYHQSMGIRPDYPDVNINLSLFHLLKKTENNQVEYDSVDYYINKADKLDPTPNQFYKLRMIEGIYLDLLDKKPASQRILNEINTNNIVPLYLREMAKINLEISNKNNSYKAEDLRNNRTKVVVKMGPPFSVIFPDKAFIQINLQDHVIYVNEEKEFRTLSFDRKFNFRIPNDGKSSNFLNETNLSIIKQFGKPHQLFHDKSQYYYIYEGGICFGFDNQSNRQVFYYIFRIP